MDELAAPCREHLNEAWESLPLREQRVLWHVGVLGVPAAEASAWVAGFEYLQLLRLGVQVGQGDSQGQPAGGEHPNRCEIATLNDIDRRVLRETLRVARRLQQRIELDYAR
mgnify:CR=1 FL=1